MSDKRTRLTNSRLRIGFIPPAGASAASVAVQAGATLVQVAVALFYGVVIGGLLTRYLRRRNRGFTTVNHR